MRSLSTGRRSSSLHLSSKVSSALNRPITVSSMRKYTFHSIYPICFHRLTSFNLRHCPLLTPDHSQLRDRLHAKWLPRPHFLHNARHALRRPRLRTLAQRAHPPPRIRKHDSNALRSSYHHRTHQPLLRLLRPPRIFTPVF